MGKGVVATHAAGHSVVAAVRDPISFDVSAFDPARMMVVEIDLRNEDKIRASVDATRVSFGRIDTLVNNAGHGVLWPTSRSSPHRFQTAQAPDRRTVRGRAR
ncbi:SDR family NAD(P)-dependent oxidoreductase [Cryobacterium aureum]|uniref:SDR family NAD(P)-dependent oxidoreductase n=1 Tax=Cryobacterium aureum TaxID=995037 RepID=UPI000CF42FE1|nr:SDR family NAD(P)-dependent oxidoreductase [Cryobacterium aureum]